MSVEQKLSSTKAVARHPPAWPWRGTLLLLINHFLLRAAKSVD
jgi:hypothetical protein